MEFGKEILLGFAFGTGFVLACAFLKAALHMGVLG